MNTTQPATSPSLAARILLIVVFAGVLSGFSAYVFLAHVHGVELAVANENGMLFYWRAYALIAGILVSVFSAVVLLWRPLCSAFMTLQSVWRPAYTVACLAVENLVAALLIVFLSNKQFGAFDQSIVVDTLWRQAIGQVPYRDFMTTNPPLFVLGLGLAQRIFGVNWNAQAFVLVAFSALTSIWVYWLARKLELRRAFAFLAMLCSQVPGLVLLSFWWFNNITAVVAGIFVLSSVCLLGGPEKRPIQLSYVFGLALLLLVKPNTAGLLLVLIVPILLLTLRRNIEPLILTATGIATSAGILWLCHVSPRLVLNSYTAVAKSRGLLFLAFGINPFYTAELYFQFVWLSFGLVLLLWKLGSAAREQCGVSVARYLILLAGFLTGLLALASNGDIGDVAFPPVFLVLCVVVFEHRRRNRIAVVFLVAFLCSTLSTELFKGITRFRIRLIGTYFLIPRLIVPVRNPFFAHMRTGPLMNTMAGEIGKAVAANPGPIYFADRLEWAYAAFRVPSPRALPVFWQTGTSYGIGQENALVERWSALRFPIVIQGRVSPYGPADWTFSPESLHLRLASDYIADRTTYPDLIIWHHR